MNTVPAPLKGMSPEPVEYTPRRGCAWLGLAGSILFVAVGLFLLLSPWASPSARPVGWLNLLFFGGCALVYLSDARRVAIALRLDATGLEYRHPRPSATFRAAWPEVVGVRIHDEERASLVVLTLGDPARLPADAAPDWARAKGGWPPLVPKEVPLSPAALRTTADDLVDTIGRFRRFYAP